MPRPRSAIHPTFVQTSRRRRRRVKSPCFGPASDTGRHLAVRVEDKPGVDKIESGLICADSSGH